MRWYFPPKIEDLRDDPTADAFWVDLQNTDAAVCSGVAECADKFYDRYSKPCHNSISYFKMHKFPVQRRQHRRPELPLPFGARRVLRRRRRGSRRLPALPGRPARGGAAGHLLRLHGTRKTQNKKMGKLTVDKFLNLPQHRALCSCKSK